MKKQKKVIHKARWQVLEGFFTSPISIWGKTLCKGLSGLGMSPLWRYVTCKTCLKMRKKGAK